MDVNGSQLGLIKIVVSGLLVLVGSWVQAASIPQFQPGEYQRANKGPWWCHDFSVTLRCTPFSRPFFWQNKLALGASLWIFLPRQFGWLCPYPAYTSAGVR
jgi:hypothetical protein